MGNVSSNSWLTNYRLLRQIHDHAFKIIEEAIALEERERPNEAIEKYKDGIHTIDKALNVVISCPDDPDDTWKAACDMVQKMKQARAEVLQRINAITSAPGFVQTDPPPTYNEATDSDGTSPSETEGSSTLRLRTYGELAEALDNLKIATPRGEADVLISCEGVQLYFINVDGQIVALEPQKLNIAMLLDGEVATYFLQVGTWLYPLVPGVSPCYRTEYDAFIFPDVHSAVEGASVGILIPEDADEIILEIFEDILLGVVSYSDKKDKLARARARQRRELPRVPEPQVESAVANGIVTGAGYFSKGLVFTAGKLGDLVNYATPKLISSIAPATDTDVSPNVRKGLQIAESTTGKAAEVTGAVATSICVATAKLGQFLAPHIERQGAKLLTSQFNFTEEDANNKMAGVLTVAAGAVEGFATVYQGLATSASILGQNLKENSVKVVQHTYGQSAAAATDSTLGAVGNVLAIRGNIQIFTPKGLAKSTVKQTGKGLVRTAAASAFLHQKQNQKEDQSHIAHPSSSNTNKDADNQLQEHQATIKQFFDEKGKGNNQ